MITITDLYKWKQQQHKIAIITVYDATFATLFSNQGIKVMLVGDSLGMTIQGHNSTLPVTLNDIIYHIKCVRRGAPSCMLLADLPFISCTTLQQTLENAASLISVGANMIKLEGTGSWIINIISELTVRSIPVCCHIGLTPQSVNMLGGYKLQGGDADSAEQLLSNAILLEKAGAQLIVLEYVPVSLAKRITQSLNIPVIGIGAGVVTDGQILVMHDVLGISGKKMPFFAKNFLVDGRDIAAAITAYILEVENKKFPDAKHTVYL